MRVPNYPKHEAAEAIETLASLRWLYEQDGDPIGSALVDDALDHVATELHRSGLLDVLVTRAPNATGRAAPGGGKMATMAHPVTAKIATDLTRKVAAMTGDARAARADEIVTTPGSGDDPTLMLELTKCIWGANADLPEVSPEEQAAYDKHVEETYTPAWFKTATRID
jgi:hypothetical protein